MFWFRFGIWLIQASLFGWLSWELASRTRSGRTWPWALLGFVLGPAGFLYAWRGPGSAKPRKQ